MSSLILVKHSLPEIVPALPASRWELSPEGCRRCWTLAQRLAEYKPRIVASSLEPKASQTALLLGAWLGVPMELCAGLHEHQRASVEFTPQAQFEASISAFFANPDQQVFGDESAEQALGRFQRSITGLLMRHPAGDLAVVSHGTVISLFVSHLCGGEPFALWKRLDLPSFVVLERPKLHSCSVIESIL